MANLPPLPPAGRAPQGGKNAPGSKANPKDARADTSGANAAKQGGGGSSSKGSRKTGDR